LITLGFDTATLSTAVGLRLADGSTLEARHDPSPGEHPGHATRLLALADGLLREAGLSWAALDRVAVGLGPGRFTGLRVGVATARAVAQSRRLELAGVSTLEALAAGASARAEDRDGILAVIDARREEAFAAAYPSRPAGPPGAIEGLPSLSPGELGAVVARARRHAARSRGPWLAVGDGAVRFRDELEAAGAEVPPDGSPLHVLDAAAVCELGSRAAAAARYEDVLPDYRRRPDAVGRVAGAAHGVLAASGVAGR
jgi:tRNA threonylcarbamoyladenosine biosynthesis protein TsaB